MARLRYTGTHAHRLSAGGRVLADVVHGTVFDCPDSWVAPIVARGTPVEVVEDEPMLVADAAEPAEDAAAEPEAASPAVDPVEAPQSPQPRGKRRR